MDKQQWQKMKAAKAEEVWQSRSGVMLEGYVENRSDGGEAFSWTKSLTDDDLDELKGCLDLGFGFSYNDIPELCNTLPALELCYSISQRFLDDQQQSHSDDNSESSDHPTIPIATWKISRPGDDPEEVKARLRYWAQAVACTVKLCSHQTNINASDSRIGNAMKRLNRQTAGSS